MRQLVEAVFHRGPQGVEKLVDRFAMGDPERAPVGTRPASGPFPLVEPRHLALDPLPVLARNELAVDFRLVRRRRQQHLVVHIEQFTQRVVHLAHLLFRFALDGLEQGGAEPFEMLAPHIDHLRRREQLGRPKQVGEIGLQRADPGLEERQAVGRRVAPRGLQLFLDRGEKERGAAGHPVAHHLVERLAADRVVELLLEVGRGADAFVDLAPDHELEIDLAAGELVVIESERAAHRRVGDRAQLAVDRHDGLEDALRGADRLRQARRPPHQPEVQRQRAAALRVPVVVGHEILPPGVDAVDQLRRVDRRKFIDILENIEAVDRQPLGVRRHDARRFAAFEDLLEEQHRLERLAFLRPGLAARFEVDLGHVAFRLVAHAGEVEQVGVAQIRLERAVGQVVGIEGDDQLPDQTLDAGEPLGGTRQFLRIIRPAPDEDGALFLAPAQPGNGFVDDAFLRVGHRRARLKVDAARLHVEEDRRRLERDEHRPAAPLFLTGAQFVADPLEVLGQHTVAVPQEVRRQLVHDLDAAEQHRVGQERGHHAVPVVLASLQQLLVTRQLGHDEVVDDIAEREQRLVGFAADRLGGARLLALEAGEARLEFGNRPDRGVARLRRPQTFGVVASRHHLEQVFFGDEVEADRMPQIADEMGSLISFRHRAVDEPAHRRGSVPPLIERVQDVAVHVGRRRQLGRHEEHGRAARPVQGRARAVHALLFFIDRLGVDVGRHQGRLAGLGRTPDGHGRARVRQRLANGAELLIGFVQPPQPAAGGDGVIVGAPAAVLPEPFDQFPGEREFFHGRCWSKRLRPIPRNMKFGGRCAPPGIRFCVEVTARSAS